MKARDIMTRPVVRVGPGTPVREAIVLLTEADALRGGGAGKGPAPDVLVCSTMTSPAETVGLDTDVTEIARRMPGDRLRGIPVVDDGVLVGIVSRRDMLSPLVRQDDSIASHLNALLSDYAGHRDHSADGTPPYVVRWTADDHVSTVFPGPDAEVLTAAEEQAAEERARARLDRVQQLIHEEDSHVRVH